MKDSSTFTRMRSSLPLCAATAVGKKKKAEHAEPREVLRSERVPTIEFRRHPNEK